VANEIDVICQSLGEERQAGVDVNLPDILVACRRSVEGGAGDHGGVVSAERQRRNAEIELGAVILDLGRDSVPERLTGRDATGQSQRFRAVSDRRANCFHGKHIDDRRLV